MNKNMYVFTTKQVIIGDSPIVCIVHDEDGDWQFLGIEDNVSEDNAMIVSLGEILEYDSSIVSMLGLPKGKVAIRDLDLGIWTIK